MARDTVGGDDRVTAVRRFGLGAKPDDLQRMGQDARGFLLAGLKQAGSVTVSAAGIKSSSENYRAFVEARVADREQRSKKGERTPRPPDMSTRMAEGEAGRAGKTAKGGFRGVVRRDVWQAEIAARFGNAVITDNAFFERLVQFWSNHFAISAKKSGPVRVMAGAFEREAIRPHVLGRFGDMLKAVEQHPAMLMYLDNDKSVGPNSRAGLKLRRGLNENLAREILELHTVGVGAGYSQPDVTNLARIITGWGVAGINQKRLPPGTFAFFRARQEPGTWSVLGRRYETGDLAAGEAVLADLARHPLTARHIASKMVRHFVGDKAPDRLVGLLQKTFLDTGGHLGDVAKALVSADDAWLQPPRKIVPPYDFMVAIARGLDVELAPRRAVRLATALGQPLWSPPSPKGWPDDDEAWMGPSAIRERLRVAEQFAAMAARRGDPREVARALLGGAMSSAETEAIARAETRGQGFELLIMSASFQRR